MSAGQPGDRNKTKLQMQNPTPQKGAKNWLRHSGQAAVIDEMLLTRSYSLDQMVTAVEKKFRVVEGRIIQQKGTNKLRHRGQASFIDALLKGSNSLDQMVKAVEKKFRIVEGRILSHFAHLQDTPNGPMGPHNLKLKTAAGKWHFVP